MLPNWTPQTAARVSKYLLAILDDSQSYPPWKVEAARRTNGLPVYADMGGVIALTLSGEFVSYDPDFPIVWCVWWKAVPRAESIFGGLPGGCWRSISGSHRILTGGNGL